MQRKQRQPVSQRDEKNEIISLLYRYLPYWPLFILLLILGYGAAYIYLYLAKPEYEISASILIKDEQKGADDERISEAISAYGPSKIVENEIEVVKSKDLLRKVIDSLFLYAPVFVDDPLLKKSAYTSSPVVVEIRRLNIKEEIPRVDFTYHQQKGKVSLGSNNYSLKQWINTSYGRVRFIRNKNFSGHAAHPLYFSVIPPGKVLDGLYSNISVSSAGKMSTVLYLTLKDAVPERGKDILNLLIDIYNTEAIHDKNLIAANTLAFVEKRIKYLVRELDSIEDRLQTFRTENRVVDLSEQGRLYLQSIGENDARMTDLDMQLSALNEAKKYVRSKDGQIGIVPSTSGIKDVLLTELLQKLFDAQVKYERLKKTVPVNNPAMLSLENEIENLRPRVMENINNQQAGITAGRDNLNRKTGLYSSMLRDIPKNERDLLEISRQQTIKNNVYSFLLQKREEVALTSASSIADSRTIERAYASSAPVSPNKKFVTGVALAISFLTAIALVYIKEVLTNKILFRSDIEAITNIPVIAEITHVKNHASLNINGTQETLLNEQFRRLRVTLALNSRYSSHKKILVTSSIPSEGKSFVSNNLAISIALSGRSVALVDLDLHRPKISTLYQLENKKGVANFLEDPEFAFGDIVFSTAHSKLFVIPAGSGKMNSTELLLNGSIQRLFDDLNNIFDFIIIDTSPIDPLTDAYILTDYCDATLFVVRHGHTPKSMIELIQETSKVKALKNMAIVFNDIRSRGFIKKRHGYGYGYGSKQVYGDKMYRARNIPAKV